MGTKIIYRVLIEEEDIHRILIEKKNYKMLCEKVNITKGVVEVRKKKRKIY